MDELKRDKMNIYDIARLSGVSIATVSRVVNGSPNVSEKTKEKVLAVIKKSEYTPNVFARGLGSVSYTHLDVYKRQMLACKKLCAEFFLHRASFLLFGEIFWFYFAIIL